MMKKLFDDQRALINAFFDAVDLEQAEKVLDACLACEGKVVFSGVGKSGVVAEKLATTLSSTGTHAAFLPPTNALHGDIGILEAKDLLVLLSKSGESEELVQLVPLAKMRGIQTVAWVSKPASLLAKLCNIAMHLPLKKELCPFDLSPTTSAAVQMIFGDILTVALMQKKQFSVDEYALNHPAGAIGKKLTMHVRDLMSTGDALPICSRDTPLEEALLELTKKRFGCILITEGDTLRGIFTDGDLRRALQSHQNVLKVRMGELMHKKFTSIGPDDKAIVALKLMEGEKKIMMLPVLKDQKLVGLIHLHDILQAGL